MLKEYIGRKSDGTVNEQWTKRPATMIRKVALVQALREAFPETLGAMYAAEEFGAVEEEVMMQNPVNPEGVMQAEVIEKKPEAPLQNAQPDPKPTQKQSVNYDQAEMDRPEPVEYSNSLF